MGFVLLVTIQAGIGCFAAGWWVLSTNLNFQCWGTSTAICLKLPFDYFQKRHLGGHRVALRIDIHDPERRLRPALFNQSSTA